MNGPFLGMSILSNKRSYDADDQHRDHHCRRSRETAGKERATDKNHTRDGQAPQKQAYSRISDYVLGRFFGKLFNQPVGAFIDVYRA